MWKRGMIPHWRAMQFFLLLLAVPIFLRILLVPFAQWIRSGRANAATPPAPAPIDGERAYRYLKEICAIGPRPAGSEANTRQRAMVSTHFTKMGARIIEQKF